MVRLRTFVRHTLHACEVGVIVAGSLFLFACAATHAGPRTAEVFACRP